MRIEMDLEYIQEMGEARDDENWAFRTFLKGSPIGSEELDTIVHEIAADVTDQIDCIQCANCCKRISPTLDEEDISTFSLGLGMPITEFQEQYLTAKGDVSAVREFRAQPCSFLEDNRCSNYECRPKDCRSYPHLQKVGFSSRLIDIINNYAICPIVFNVYEQLKIEIWNGANVR
jgi:Fe-S-cluster containining protein